MEGHGDLCVPCPRLGMGSRERRYHVCLKGVERQGGRELWVSECLMLCLKGGGSGIVLGGEHVRGEGQGLKDVLCGV